MWSYSNKTKIISGEDSVSALKELGIGRLFLVSDPYFVKNGQAQRIAGLCRAQAVEIFDEIQPDPQVEQAAQGTAKVRAFAPDTIVALGGGSAMDCAKAMAYFAGGDIRLVAIPTTSGSGAEVTDFAILTHQGVKHPLVDEKLRPDVAILDGALLKELPGGLVADTGFDILTHAVEAFAATNAGTLTDALASEAFCAAFAMLPASFAGNTGVRQRIHEAAAMAGMAFSQAGLGLCHAMAHALGGAFHVPHGRLNAILLPAVLMKNAAAEPGRYAELARSAGIGAASDVMAVRELKNRLLGLRRELMLPETLAQAGVDPAVLRQREQQIIQAALADPCCGTNPVKPEPHMVREILSQVAGRG